MGAGKGRCREASGPWKQDPGDYVAALRRHGIRRLLHYTPIGNLDSILEQGGLLSRREQQLRKLPPGTAHGWGEKWRPLEDYVCLSLEPPLGLLRQEKRPMAALVVRPEAAALRGTLFCPMNSARSWIGEEEIRSRCDLESFEDLFREAHSPVLKNRESEMLIRGSLGLWAVRRIVLPNAEVYRSVRGIRRRCFRLRLLRRARFPEWSVDREGEFFL